MTSASSAPPSVTSRQLSGGGMVAAAANFSTSLPSQGKVLELSKINQDILRVEYAVRGEIAIRAEELRNQLRTDPESLPFKTVVNCNIGNPQQLQQRPITFFRQVSSLVDYPDLLLDSNLAITSKLYPADAIQRAKEYLAAIGSSGAYSHSQGIPIVREQVARFISERDGYPSSPDEIFLTAGASPGVQLILQTIIAHSKVGIMIPIPQYPLYTASIALFKGQAVPYYLEEENEWGMSVKELRRSLEESRGKGLEVRALCVINPGNPTGQCIGIENMREIIDFCHKENLVLLADEVYQTNVYMPDRRPFHSFKKVLKSMGPSYDDFELISFHSVSKGMVGECGRRGGYFECTGIDSRVREQLYKISSISLCPAVNGQLMVGLMTNPPRPGDESFELYKNEINGIYESLRRRAETLSTSLNQLEGVTCNPAQGAMYLFPQIVLPKNVVQAARKANREPDELYCLELLNATGVCVVPGSGFLQKEGTYHFRSTFLAPEDQMDEFANKLTEFHKAFLAKYK